MKRYPDKECTAVFRRKTAKIHQTEEALHHAPYNYLSNGVPAATVTNISYRFKKWFREVY